MIADVYAPPDPTQYMHLCSVAAYVLKQLKLQNPRANNRRFDLSLSLGADRRIAHGSLALTCQSLKGAGKGSVKYTTVPS